MKNYLTLIKLQARMALKSFTSSASIDKSNKKNVRSTSRIIGVIILFLVMAVYMGVIEWYLIGALISLQNTAALQPVLNLLHVQSLPDILFVLVVIVSMMLTLFFSLYQLAGKMYYSKDTPLYGALPISGRSLYAARLTEVYLEEAALAGTLLLSLTIIYMVRLGFDFMLLIRAIIVSLLCPVIPMAVAALLVHLLAHVSLFNRHRDAVIMIGSILMIVFQMVLSFSLSSTVSRFSDDEAGLAGALTNILTGERNIVTSLTSIFPPAGWAAMGLLGSWPMMARIFVISAALAVFLICLCGRNYLPIALKGSETHVASKSVRMDKVSYRSTHAGTAFMMLELRDILRSPVYLLNAVIGSVGMPLLMIGGLAMGFSSSVDGNMANGIKQLLDANIPGFAISAGIAAFLSFMAGINVVASTSVSREGRTHSIYRSLPVTPRTIITAKLHLSLACCMFGTVLAIGLLIILMPFLYKELLLALLWSLLLDYIMTCLALWIDCIHPKMHWNNENEAMKQNFNSLLGMLLGFAVLGLIVLIGILWILVSNLPQGPFVPVMTLIMVILAVLCRLIILYPAERKYAALEG